MKKKMLFCLPAHDEFVMFKYFSNFFLFMFEVFIKELISSVNPFAYKTLCLHPFGKSVRFFSKLLLLFYIVFIVLLIPEFMEIPGYLNEKISHVAFVDINGTFDMTEPIFIPDKNPFLVVDTSGNFSELKSAGIIFTKDSVKYKTLSVFNEARYSDLKNVKSKSGEISSLLVFFVMLLAPSFVVAGYFVFFLKYLLWSFVFGTATFLLLDLTTFSVSYKKILNIACFSLIAVIPFELVFSGLNHSYLLPLFDIFRIPFYAVTLLLYLILYLFALAVVIHDSKSKTSVDI